MEEKFDLYESYNTLIICKNKKAICAIDGSDFHEVSIELTNEKYITSFYFILGLYKYETHDNKVSYSLVLVTEIEKSNFFNICKINSFKIVNLSSKKPTTDMKEFFELLKIGLNHCSMYFSDKYNLTLTFEQQFQNLPSRTYFIWNYEAINCLKQVWPNAKCFKEVIAGYFQKVDPFIMITRKSNRNNGCHSWNRGADIEGNAANFLENEEIMITNNEETKTIENCHIDAVSHFEISASCPILWSKYPTMQLSRPFEFGPDEENERRFNLHFDHLKKMYLKGNEHNDETKCDKKHGKRSLFIISLLNNHGKELKLNTIYKELAKKRGIRYKHIKFNHLLRKGGQLAEKISKLTKYFDATIVKDGKLVQKQLKIIRVNCSSCLDRTNIFMEMLFQFIFEKQNYALFTENIDNHKLLWHNRAEITAREYALTRGMKTYLIESDYQTFRGKYFNHFVLFERFLCSIFCEGLYCDAYNAVLQERPFLKFDNYSFFWKIILFIQLIVIFVYLLLFEGAEMATKIWKKKIKTIINHPHISELLDAYEYYDNSPINMKNNNVVSPP